MRRLLLTIRRSYRAALIPLEIFSIFWLGILAFPETGFELLGVYAAVSVLVTSGAMTFMLRIRSSSTLFRIVPGYNRTQIAAGLGISLASVILSAVILAHHGHAFIPVFVGLWFLSVMAEIAAVYFLDFFIVPLLGLILVAWSFWSDPLNPVPNLVRLLTTEFTLPLLIVNAVLTALIIRRMLGINEEAVEYFSVERLSADASSKKEARMRRLMDSIPHPLPQNLRAQIRHLQLRHGFLPGTLPKLTVAFVAMFLFFRFINSSEDWLEFPRIIFLMPLWTLMVRRRSAQWFLMLPLRRSELILKSGVAMGLLLLKVSFAAALAVTVASWRLPPWDFLLIATTLQVPVLGAFAFISSIREVWKKLIFVVVFNVLGAIGLQGWKMSSIYLPVSACLVAGAAMIWLSYNRWCNLDVD